MRRLNNISYFNRLFLIWFSSLHYFHTRSSNFSASLSVSLSDLFNWLTNQCGSVARLIILLKNPAKTVFEWIYRPLNSNMRIRIHNKYNKCHIRDCFWIRQFITKKWTMRWKLIPKECFPDTKAQQNKSVYIKIFEISNIM